MAEIDWARVERRRAEYEAWTDVKADAGYLGATAGTVARGSDPLSGLSVRRANAKIGQEDRPRTVAAHLIFVRQSVARWCGFHENAGSD